MGRNNFGWRGCQGIELKKFAKLLSEPTRLQECPHKQNVEVISERVNSGTG